ncbi:MAG: GNAT family N-acetyltransferase [Flavobacteriales bacterium]|nr:GNAT family N-acetyltransferase [Flavobacteriales bacterium]
MIVKFCITEEDFKKIMDLRYEILRKPWNQSYESSSDGNESETYNAFIEANNKAIACGRLQLNSDEIAQIRYMAVSNENQGQGLGAKILIALEQKVKEIGVKKIELHARENAVAFYKKHGYAVKEKSHNLWDQIQHYLMEKALD